MAFPSLAVIAKHLSEADIERLLALKRAGPRLFRLEAERKKLADQLAEIDRQIAAFAGGEAPKKRGRKPGRKRGRPAKASAAPAKRGRPPKVKPAAKVGRPRGRPAKAGPEREAMLARMAKARAARKVAAKG